MNSRFAVSLASVAAMKRSAHFLSMTRYLRRIVDGTGSRTCCGAAALPGSPLPGSPLRDSKQQLATDPYAGTGEYQAVRRLLETHDYAGVIATLKASALRGLGGAGFPTGLKWEIVRNAPGEQKYIVCNADESEPGTIKDRFIMQHLPYLVIEGMILAGLVTGAKKGYLYIRHEYEEPKEFSRRRLERCYREHVLGENMLGSGRTLRSRNFCQSRRIYLRRGKRPPGSLGG